MTSDLLPRHSAAGRRLKRELRVCRRPLFALPSPHDGATAPHPRRREGATRSSYPYELPAGLAADQEVLVLSYDPRTCNHLVRDESGREWTVKARQNLDAGSEYRVSHRWVREDHPEVVARLESSAPDDR